MAQPSNLEKLKAFLLDSLAREMEGHSPASDQFRLQAGARLERLYERTGVHLEDAQRDQLLREILDEIAGYGPIQPLLDDPTISEIMVNGPKSVFIEREGELIETGLSFRDEEHVMHLIDRIVSPLGKRVDQDNPMVDARLPTGERVNVIIPPVSIVGPCITIRKFLKNKMTMQDLISMGTLTENMAEFLQACVAARLNMLVSGPTSSGKTTFLNVLTTFIPERERILTIEDAAELQLKQKHVIAMENRPPGVDGAGAVTTRDLVRNCLRMRPDRIIVGEVRSGEALDMLQAMNTGHYGSLTTIHANSPRDATSRLETMVLMAGLDLPLIAIRRQIASAIQLVVHLARMPDGSRKTTQITEISGMEGDIITMSDLFKFEQTGIDANGKIAGRMVSTGLRPMFSPRLEVVGYRLRPEIFGVPVGKSRSEGFNNPDSRGSGRA